MHLFYYNIFLSLLLLIVSHIKAQDLIMNGDFEDVNNCELHYKCAPEAWRLTSSGSIKFSDCSNNAVSFTVYYSQIRNCRSYVESRLSDTLIVGEEYTVSFDLTPNRLFVDEIGVLFSEKIILTSADYLLDIEPDVKFSEKKRLLKPHFGAKSLHLEADFIAETPSIYIIIGSFTDDQEQLRWFRNDNGQNYIEQFYSIDNVKLISKNNLHDPEEFEIFKQVIYAQNVRHPYPDYLCVVTKIEEVHDVEIAQIEELPELKTDTLSLQSELVFAYNKYEPSPQLYANIDSIFSMLQYQADSIVVIGHTDNTGTVKHNEELSQNRAGTVADYIIEAQYIDEDKISFYGVGSRFPLVDNNSEESRSKNRRVEIIIYYSSVSDEY